MLNPCLRLRITDFRGQPALGQTASSNPAQTRILPRLLERVEEAFSPLRHKQRHSPREGQSFSQGHPALEEQRQAGQTSRPQFPLVPAF